MLDLQDQLPGDILDQIEYQAVIRFLDLQGKSQTIYEDLAAIHYQMIEERFQISSHKSMG